MNKVNEANFTLEPIGQGIVITNIFDASRELVFNTYMDSKLIPRWWGPKTLKTTVDKMDVKRGGVWRFVQRDSEDNEYAFYGVYHEIIPLERIIFTFEFEGMPGHVLLETVKFEDYDDGTKVVDNLVFQTVEDRDGMLESGMEEGSTESHKRFTELLKDLQKIK